MNALLSKTPSQKLPASMCAACGAQLLSMCASLDRAGRDELEALLEPVSLASGDVLFEEGAPATRSFNLIEGCLKLYKLLPDGRRLVTDFLYPGDFLGLADKDHYTCTAEAVGAATLCRFERSALDDLVQRQSCLEGHLLDRARAELADGRSQLLLLGHKTARERVASFILTQSARAVQRGLSASPVETPMRRVDIADHLGLTTETVSRTLTGLTADGMIGVEAGRRIIIRETDQLAALAAGHKFHKFIKN
ncbi:MAG: cyclic nucleotide-binding domain-containing protein [Alphaproteobacteria bacterium]|jgi:CRP/FNR family transcriptional regulator, anaerobic regulatory protein|nr:cyclic nucleotide-binding domain-containing protein [Alphaproteobacteria bacterium]MBT4967277.1 cyclic nucleotide-binding domain-containing protein [Alphaproteobacteria bacterium]MBT5917434.1 cyclic nucleotide-binding domain-containing protein [Alphaproteobacteria bacterium]